MFYQKAHTGTYIFICCEVRGYQVCMEAWESQNRPDGEEANHQFDHSAQGESRLATLRQRDAAVMHKMSKPTSIISLASHDIYIYIQSVEQVVLQ